MLFSRKLILWTRAEVKYLLRATFNAADVGFANGQVLDTPGEMGENFVGQLTVVEVDGTLAIVSNKCAFTAQATPVWGDLGLYSQAIPRALGRGLLCAIDPGGAGNDNERVWGWSATAVATYTGFESQGCYADLQVLYTLVAGSGTIIASYSNVVEYQHAQVLGGYDVNGVPWRSGQAASSYLYGSALYIKGGAFANWTLLWRALTGNTATLYATIGSKDWIGTLDDFRVPTADLSAVLQPNNLSTFASAGELDVYVPDVGGVWTEDIGDWDTAGGVLQATALGIASFTGLADCLYETRITTPGAGVVAGGLVLRGTDYTGASEDYWYVQVTPGTAGADFSLIEYVAGGATVRASADVDWAAATSYIIRAVCYGQTIDCYHSKGTWGRITYAVAASGQTATSFGLRDEGNANMTFDNVALFPRTSSVYNTILDVV